MNNLYIMMLAEKGKSLVTKKNPVIKTNSLSLGTNIHCEKNLICDARFVNILNHRDLSTLDNFCRSEKAIVQFESLEDCKSGNVMVNVMKKGINGKRQAKINLAAAETDFSGTIKNLYVTVEKLLNILKK